MGNFDALEPWWREIVAGAAAALPAWRDRVAQPPTAPAGSALAEDDRLSTPWPVSTAAYWCLLSATDHLDLLLTSLEHTGKRPIAHFTVSRAALFGAARAIWILAPEDRTDRQKNALWFAFDNVRNLRNAVEEMLNSGLSANLPVAKRVAMLEAARDRVEEVKTIAANELALTISRNSGEWVPTDTQIVTDAATHLDPDGSEAGAALLYTWRVTSGYAHGFGWPELLTPAAQVVTTDDGTRYRAVTGDDQAIVDGIAATTRMTEKAFELYEQRSTPH